VVSGELRGREGDADVVLFKSHGLAVWDVAIGVAALELARERGVGREV
jgi:ornithine cyclodeaminase/alanine dehydrogenase-like protein (mu-crystallin family)